MDLRLYGVVQVRARAGCLAMRELICHYEGALSRGEPDLTALSLAKETAVGQTIVVGEDVAMGRL